MDIAWFYLQDFGARFEDHFKGIPKWQLILGSISVTSSIVWIRDVIDRRKDVIADLKRVPFRLLKRIPAVQRKIETEMNSLEEEIKSGFFDPKELKVKCFSELPLKGRTAEEVTELAESIFKMGKFEWQSGKVSGGVNTGSNPAYTSLLTQVYHAYSWSNPLHADVFPGVRKMEAEVVRMTSSLFHGDSEAVGCMTSGGTESLLMAMKAYRDYARAYRKIFQPEVVACYTVHAAIEKAAGILGYKYRMVGAEKNTWMVNISEVEKAINKNTVLLVVSAPDYAHGIIDDVEEMSSLALKYDIPLHVDCCLGGFILPFMEAAGFPLKPFDFRLPGVTSISADTHKYGNCPKGTSVVMYRNKEYRHHQYFVATDWPGGVYATATVPGSRPGANIAMCWAALLHFGFDGYVKLTKDIISAARTVKKAISTIDGIYLYGDPLGPVVSFGSDELNIIKVCDTMTERGWHLQPLQNPPGMHIFFTSLHTAEGVVDTLIADLRKAVEQVRSKPNDVKDGWAKLYGSVNSLPDKSILVDAAKIYLKTYYCLSDEIKAKTGTEEES